MQSSARRAAVSFAALFALACSSPKSPELHAPPAGDGVRDSAAQAPKRETRLQAVLELRDGSRIVGTPLASGFTLKSAYGAIDFTLDRVGLVTFSDSAGGVTIEFRNGDIVRGTLTAQSIAVEFAAGKLVLPVASILRISPASADGDVLQGLVAHYPLHGNASDATGHGYDGVNYGAVPAPDRFGVAGNACAFDGKDARIHLPEGIIDPDCAGCTVSMWVMTNSSRPPREAFYIGAATAEFSIWNVGGEFRVGPGLIDGRMHEVFAPAPENVFVHLTAVYLRGKWARLYINGELKSEISLPDIPLRSGLSEYSSGIGTYAPQHPEHGRRFGRLNWSGRISDVRIYNRALNDGEIIVLARPGS